MSTCTLTFSAVDTALQVKPNATLIFEPTPRVIRGLGATVMAPDKKTVVADASGAGSIALAPGAYRLAMDSTGGTRQVDITVPDAPTALLGDLIDTPIGEWEFSALQTLRSEVIAAAGQVAIDRTAVATDRVLTQTARTDTLAAAPIATDAAAQALVSAGQAAVYAGSFGPGMMLHRPDETIPAGWWDTGLRQSATSELWGNTATLALISNWSTASLYTGGIATAWFDFSTASREFQDVLGTALTAAGQSVGMVRDAISPLTFGPELIVNGGFESASEWVFGSGWSIGAGVATKVAGVATNIRQTNTVAIVALRVYRLRLDVTVTAGTLTPSFMNSASQVVSSGPVISASGPVTQYLVAPAGAARIAFQNNATFEGTIDNVSLQEVLGVVATQPSASLRGKWASSPVAGVRNRVIRSEPTLAQVWSVSNVSDAATPIAGFLGSVQFGDNSLSRHAYMGAVSGVFSAGSTATLSIYVQMDDGGVPAPGPVGTGDMTLVVGGGIIASPQITHIGAGVYRLSGTAVLGTNISNNGVAKYLGSSSRSFRVAGWQVEAGSNLTPYQRVVSSDDITESGARNSGMWRPDLVDDALTFNLPAAVDGELILMGRNGSWREPRPAASGQSVVIGGTGAGTLATPGILRATGPLVAMGFRAGALTADEWLRLKRRWRSEGAKGELIQGSNLVVNGAFAADLAGWTTNPARGLFEWAGGTARITDSSAGITNFAQQEIATVAGQSYLASADVVEAASTQTRLAAGTTSGTSGLGTTTLGTGQTGRLQFAFVATTTTTFLWFANASSSAANALSRWDNISVRALTPEW